MGLWGKEADFFVPDRLPALPCRKLRCARTRSRLKPCATACDLRIAKLEVEAVAKSHGLTQATRYVTDLELIAGVEYEREIETEIELHGRQA